MPSSCGVPLLSNTARTSMRSSASTPGRGRKTGPAKTRKPLALPPTARTQETLAPQITEEEHTMEDKGIRTPSYVELSSQAYGMFVEAYAAANQRALAYMKSLYEIASKPYPTTGPEAFVSERFDRAHQIVDLTVN